MANKIKADLAVSIIVTEKSEVSVKNSRESNTSNPTPQHKKNASVNSFHPFLFDQRKITKK